MKNKNYIKHCLLACMLIPMLSSCNDWLAVEMEDGMMEDQLYRDNEGYKAVLNGVYAKMNENYSTTLTMGVLDVMAQYYNVRKNSNHRFYVYANYNFSDATFEKSNGSVWTSQYDQIANLNTLLEHIDAGDSGISPLYYNVIKGEALALRGFLHFDLLRLYGPIYNESSENVICIPYQESSSKEIQPLLTAKVVMDKVIRDLKAAADLLENDPIRTKGVMAEESDDPNENSDFRFRQYRLNYYAVQVLLARAYMWVGDKTKALDIVRNLIAENEENLVFPWTPKTDVQNTETPDRLFSTEVMFALYNNKRVSLFDSYFKKTASVSSILSFKGETIASLEGKIPHFYSETNDLRRGSNFWSEEVLEQSSSLGSSTQKAICFSKYADVSTPKPYRYMIPLIRMSEVYLMAAECTDNLSEAIGYINKVRGNRNCVNLELQTSDTKESIQTYITDEFTREVIGEGQLYFYYKRLAMDEILSGSTFEEDWWSGDWIITDNISLQDYVWPLPKIEIDKRVNDN